MSYHDKLSVGLVFLLVCTATAGAAELPPNDGYITDEPGILTAEQESALEQKLQSYAENSDNELAVVILKNLAGENIADVALDIGRKWGIGKEGMDNGILLLVSYDERKIFIATGYGVEGLLPDISVKNIIDHDILPPFREGDYNMGLTNGIDAIQKHLSGTYTEKRYEETKKNGGATKNILIVFLIILQFLGSFMARTKSWWLGGVLGGLFGAFLTYTYGFWLSIPILVCLGLAFDFFVSRNASSHKARRYGSRVGIGRRGGGFGGFGGGSFGGGGAGGKW